MGVESRAVAFTLDEADETSNAIKNGSDKEAGINVLLTISGSVTVTPQISLDYDPDNPTAATWTTMSTSYTSSNEFWVDVPGKATLRLKATSYSSGSATGYLSR